MFMKKTLQNFCATVFLSVGAAAAAAGEVVIGASIPLSGLLPPTEN